MNIYRILKVGETYYRLVIEKKLKLTNNNNTLQVTTVYLNVLIINLKCYTYIFKQ